MRVLSLMMLLLFTVALLVGSRIKLVLGDVGVNAYDTMEPVAHVLVFAMLTVVVLAARWPLRPGYLLGLLVVYALASEWIQAVMPHRTPQLLCFVQDLAGVAAGFGAWWLLGRLMAARNTFAKRRKAPLYLEAQPITRKSGPSVSDGT